MDAVETLEAKVPKSVEVDKDLMEDKARFYEERLDRLGTNAVLEPDTVETWKKILLGTPKARKQFTLSLAGVPSSDGASERWLPWAGEVIDLLEEMRPRLQLGQRTGPQIMELPDSNQKQDNNVEQMMLSSLGRGV
jgi:hypothetical protein